MGIRGPALCGCRDGATCAGITFFLRTQLLHTSPCDYKNPDMCSRHTCSLLCAGEPGRVISSATCCAVTARRVAVGAEVTSTSGAEKKASLAPSGSPSCACSPASGSLYGCRVETEIHHSFVSFIHSNRAISNIVL